MMEWKRDKTIQKIAEDDAAMAAKAKKDRASKGFFS